MGRTLGSWLSGPGAAVDRPTTSGTDGDRGQPGARLGLPATGPGSIATVLARVGAFCVDAVLSGLVAGLFTAPDLPRNWSVVALVAEYVVFTALFGQTPGMRLVGIRLARLVGDRSVAASAEAAQGGPAGAVSPSASLGVPRAVVRAVLLVLLVPALIWDADRRGLHDRVAGTVMVRA